MANGSAPHKISVTSESAISYIALPGLGQRNVPYIFFYSYTPGQVMVENPYVPYIINQRASQYPPHS